MSMTKQEYYTKLEEDEKYSDIYWENESSPIDEYMEKTHNSENRGGRNCHQSLINKTITLERGLFIRRSFI